MAETEKLELEADKIVQVYNKENELMFEGSVLSFNKICWWVEKGFNEGIPGYFFPINSGRNWSKSWLHVQSESAC